MFGDQAHNLLPPNDAGAVAKAMERAVNDPQTLVSQAETLHARTSQLFNLDHMVQGVCDFYDAILRQEMREIPSTIGQSQAETPAG